MKIFYKNRLKKYYENMNEIFKGKNNYLKNLNRKKNDGLKIIKEQKSGIIIEDIFKINKLKRDYSCFSHNSEIDDKNIPIKIKFSPIKRKYPVEQTIKKVLSNKKMNNIQLEKFPYIKHNNYSKFPKSNLPIRYTNNLNKRNKLANAGKEIITKRDSLMRNNSYIY